MGRGERERGVKTLNDLLSLSLSSLCLAPSCQGFAFRLSCQRLALCVQRLVLSAQLLALHSSRFALSAIARSTRPQQEHYKLAGQPSAASLRRISQQQLLAQLYQLRAQRSNVRHWQAAVLANLQKHFAGLCF